MLSNIHMHTRFCDGGEEPVSYVRSAIEKGLVSVGFSAHAPVPFDTNWALSCHRLQSYIEEITRLKEEFNSQIQVYLGLELDYFPDIVPYSKSILASGTFDYFIGSVHFIDAFPDGRRWTIDCPNDEFRIGFSQIFDNDPVEVTRKYFDYTRKMIRDLNPPVIGHIDKLKMQYHPDCYIPENHPVFREELLKTFETAQKAGSIVEINTRGIYKNGYGDSYPGRELFAVMNQMGLKVTVNSDAHLPHEITGEFQTVFNALRKSGFKTYSVLLNGHFEEVDIPKS